MPVKKDEKNKENELLISGYAKTSIKKYVPDDVQKLIQSYYGRPLNMIACGYYYDFMLIKGKLYKIVSINMASNRCIHTQIDTSKVGAIQHIVSARKILLVLSWNQGKTQVWGMINNSDGQLGIRPDAFSKLTQINTFNVGGNIKQIAVGEDFWLLLTDKGQVWGMGNNSDGQLGDGSKKVSTLTQIDTCDVGKHIKQIAVGGSFWLLLTDKGQVWGMGNNYYGQFGNGPEKVSTLTEIYIFNLGSKIDQIVVGDHKWFMLIWNQGETQLWGMGRLSNTFLTSRPKHILL